MECKLECSCKGYFTTILNEKKTPLVKVVVEKIWKYGVLVKTGKDMQMLI